MKLNKQSFGIGKFMKWLKRKKESPYTPDMVIDEDEHMREIVAAAMNSEHGVFGKVDDRSKLTITPFAKDLTPRTEE